jgi:hypothetical protein
VVFDARSGIPCLQCDSHLTEDKFSQENKLMPVDVYGSKGDEWGAFQLMVPDEMLGHPVMSLGATKEETAEIWRRVFSGFNGSKRGELCQASARVLAYNDRLI